MRLGVAFEFVTTLEVGFALDSKGIREAIEQEAPNKAFDSFGLIDTFDGVDKPMITLTGSVAVAVSVSAGFIEVGISGGIQFIATIDLFDPNPQQSGGLVRPYELLTAGSSPLEWFEFSLRIKVFVRIYIKIIIDFWFGKITLFSFSETFTTELIAPRMSTPELSDTGVSLNVSSGLLQLPLDDDKPLACTSLSGSVGNEIIECFSGGNAFNSFSNVKQIGNIVGAAKSGRRLAGAKNITLQGVRSAAAFGIAMNELKLNYLANGADLLDSIRVGASQVMAGPSSVTFTLLESGRIVLPRPEEQLLVTTFGNCSDDWVLEGHTNLRVNANDVNEGCTIKAAGGTYTNAQLIIDFGFEEMADCDHGYQVNVTVFSPEYELERNWTRVVISRPDMLDGIVMVDVGSVFADIQIKMSECDDKVLVEGVAARRFDRPCTAPAPTPTPAPAPTPRVDRRLNRCGPFYWPREKIGSVSVYGGGGNDDIVIGNLKNGLDDLSVTIIVDGGANDDNLVVEDSAGSMAMFEGGELNSGSLAQIPPFYRPINVGQIEFPTPAPDCGCVEDIERSFLHYVNIESLEIRLGDSTSFFNVLSTAPGCRTTIKPSADGSTTSIYSTRSDIEVSGGDVDEKIFVVGLEDEVVPSADGNEKVLVIKLAEDENVAVRGGAGDDALWLGATGKNRSNSLRWSGGVGNDIVHAFFNTMGQYDLEIFDDVDGVNAANIACADDTPCLIWSREDSIANMRNFNDLMSYSEKISIDHQSAHVQSVFLLLSYNETNEVRFDDTFATMDIFGGKQKDGEYVLAFQS